MASIRGEQIIGQAFKNEGVDTIFFMMGGPTSGTAASCLTHGMQGIYVRHEQAAAMMAHAYARVTGKPGICITPSGPGTANAVTGLANAWADAAPIVAIGGSAPIRATTLDAFQEMDQLAMMKPVVKAAYRIDMVQRIPEYVSIAFREAMDGKKGTGLPGPARRHPGRQGGGGQAVLAATVSGREPAGWRPGPDPASRRTAASGCQADHRHRQWRAVGRG